MESSKTTLKAALRSWAAESGQALGDHPSLETLVAYHEGELTAAAGRSEDLERLQDHLVLCADCAALLVDLADFESPETPAVLTDGDVAAAWRRISPLVTAAPAPVADNVLRMPLVPPPSREAAPRRRSWQTWALAASFLLVVGISAWALLLLQENRALRQPSTVAAIYLSVDVRRGSEPSLSGSQAGVLDLTLPAGSPTGDLEIEIVGNEPSGRVVWIVHAKPDAEVVRVMLPAHSVKPGRYQIHIYSTEGGRRLQAAEYRLEIVP